MTSFFDLVDAAPLESIFAVGGLVLFVLVIADRALARHWMKGN